MHYKYQDFHSSCIKNR